jgi:spermidine synthase
VSAGTYAGVFLVALATLTYEILLTRIFSVTMLYHFAFVALSLAMFGMTAGALIVYLAPSAFPASKLRERLALFAVLFPIALVLSFLTQLSIPFRVHPSIVAIYAIALTYVVIAVPFVISGIVICLALTGYVSHVSRLYAADLAGAALGCVLLIPLVGWSDAATAVLWVAAIAALAAVAFGRQSDSRRLRATAAAVAVVLTASAAGHTLLVHRQFAIFRILYVKGDFEARPLYEKWNSYSRVRVNGDVGREVLPQGWGLSRTLPADLRVHQLQMDIDVAAGTVMTGFDGDLSKIQHLTYDVTNMGYYLRPKAESLVIGAGGGRDVLSALAFGSPSVTAVEINRDILRTVNGRFGDFTGHLDRDPRVHFVNDEARSYVARTPARYDMIQISLIDTWAATAAGAFVLSENSIYTVEAWATFLSRLTDHGVLSVSRWYFRDRPDEVYRITTLAVESLARVGIQDPRRHLAVIRNMHLANRPEMPDGVGTLLVSRAPFTNEELDALDREAARLQFEVVFSPRVSTDPTFDKLTSGQDLRAFIASHPTNIAAPTDDSPFFFNMLRLRDFARLDLLEAGKQSHNVKAVATLALLLVIVTVLTATCILLPLWLTRQRVPMAGTGGLFTFFIAIGLGFMLIETSQMQRLIIALGHPTYGLSVVLFGLLLSSGLGSYMTAGVGTDSVAESGTRRLVLLAVVLLIFGVTTPAIVRAVEPAQTAWRIAAAVAVLFPIGVMMGMAFPLGIKLAARTSDGLTPWFWGLNGAASVLSSVLSVCIALTWSISTAFWCGWICYLLALAAFVLAARRPAILKNATL